MQKTRRKRAVKLRPDAVLKEFWRDNDRFADLPLKEEIGLVVGTITESDTFIKSALHREKEDFNMCKALEELEEKCREEGIERGIEVMILDNLEEGVAPSRIQEKLVKRFDLSPGQAKEYYDKFACLK